MASNTRGKLKEHYEGVHRNLDWATHHVIEALSLIRGQLSYSDAFIQAGTDPDAQEAVLVDNPIYAGTKALGDGIKTLDELAQGVYAKL